MQIRSVFKTSKHLSLTRRVGYGILVAVMAFSAISWYRPGNQANATGSHLMLLWDPGAGYTLPGTWSVVTSLSGNSIVGKFPRGDTVANFGLQGGSATNTPTVASTSMVTNETHQYEVGGTGTQAATSSHSHSVPTPTIDAVTNGGAYRSYELIEFNSGIPTVVPAGAIAMFDSTPGPPATGWTTLSAMNGRTLQINSTVANGGSDTPSYTLHWGSGLGPGDTTNNVTCLLCNGGNTTASGSHTHTLPATSTNPTTTEIPPFIGAVFAQATVDTNLNTVGLTGFFDGDPGTGWTVRSNSGGDFNGLFVRGVSSYTGTPGGASTATPAAGTVTSGAASANGPAATNLLLGVSSSTHTHTITINFNSVSITPAYFNVVVAEKVNFILKHYAWFRDVSSENVTTAWSSLVPEDVKISSLPVAMSPPDTGAQLRLRWQMLVNGNSMASSSITFKLQYAATTSSNCGSTSVTWTDVGDSTSSEIWRYGTSTVSDGTQLSASHISPTSNVLETYIKSSSSPNNPTAVGLGQTAEYDFLIQDNGANPATQYSFRMIDTTSLQPFGEYDVCPTIQTAPQTANELRHGEFFEDGQDAGFAWVN